MKRKNIILALLVILSVITFLARTATNIKNGGQTPVAGILHALAARFRHPLSGDETEIRTPYPSWANL